MMHIKLRLEAIPELDTPQIRLLLKRRNQLAKLLADASADELITMEFSDDDHRRETVDRADLEQQVDLLDGEIYDLRDDILAERKIAARINRKPKP
jgi:hypothetical protein